ncbi:hypothetical protein ANCCAN_10140 [Ancylostoma caninum]|uniref:Uncharacterized protein n=1 Tax=Ancylostoma caninum TaxID=29170 RepID=A0A368GJL2_ANCCA|nr:hypothetical protein ANCCAN_10140 [Ancylostoma caninum]
MSFTMNEFGMFYIMRGGVLFVNIMVGIAILIVTLHYFSFKRHVVNSSSPVLQGMKRYQKL